MLTTGLVATEKWHLGTRPRLGTLGRKRGLGGRGLEVRRGRADTRSRLRGRGRGWGRRRGPALARARGPGLT